MRQNFGLPTDQPLMAFEHRCGVGIDQRIDFSLGGVLFQRGQQRRGQQDVAMMA